MLSTSCYSIQITTNTAGGNTSQTLEKKDKDPFQPGHRNILFQGRVGELNSDIIMESKKHGDGGEPGFEKKRDCASARK